MQCSPAKNLVVEGLVAACHDSVCFSDDFSKFKDYVISSPIPIPCPPPEGCLL